jgi:hypothetical protein
MSTRHIFIRRTVIARRIALLGYIFTFLGAICLFAALAVAVYVDAGILERLYFDLTLLATGLFAFLAAPCFLLSGDL